MEKDHQDLNDRLLSEFIAGETSAFEEILGRYKSLVLNIAYRFLQDRTDAEDAAQDVFLKLFQSAKKYEPRAKFTTWLYKITANVCLNRLREKKKIPYDLRGRDPNQHRNHASAFCGAADPALSLAEEFEMRDLRKIVKTALGALPPSQRLAVILKRYESLSYREIAEILECSVPAVDSLLQRAKNNLKKTLGAHIKK